METVNTIPDSNSILKTDAPVVELYTHMNRLYMFLEQNSQCYRGQDYVSISVVVTAYGEDQDGNLNKDDYLSSWSNVYPQYQINQRQHMEGFPPYNIWAQLSNHWYSLELRFNYQSVSESGANDYESKVSRFEFDNRRTTLSNGTSVFFTGMLRDNLTRETSRTSEHWDEFNVTIGDQTQAPNYKLWDLVATKNATMIKQVRGLDPTIQLLPCEDNYLGLIRYILNHEQTGAIFLDNFQDTMQDPDTTGEFTFRLYLNKQSYWIHFKGNFQFLIDKATEEANNG